MPGGARLAHGRGHGGQRRVDDVGEQHVVEPITLTSPGTSHAEPLQALDHTDRQRVVVGEHGGGALLGDPARRA